MTIPPSFIQSITFNQTKKKFKKNLDQRYHNSPMGHDTLSSVLKI